MNRGDTAEFLKDLTGGTAKSTANTAAKMGPKIGNTTAMAFGCSAGIILCSELIKNNAPFVATAIVCTGSLALGAPLGYHAVKRAFQNPFGGTGLE
ncbi:MAG: hypothetical protein EOO99_11320 [Pedobacter sp.]|nr:MAG: hypothetical protein EOO99_11320 [Pedobacter sp.]